MRSPAPKETISIGKHVEDLEALRKALGVERVHLRSHSAGTQLAMHYLRDHPEGVGNLVLVGATDPKNGEGFFTPEELKAFAKVEEDRRRFNERPEIQAEIARAGLDREGLTVREAALLSLLRNAGAEIYRIERWREVRPFRVNADAAAATQGSIVWEYDYAPMLAAHRGRITVINGMYDFVVGGKGSPVWARLVAEEARNVNLVLLDRAGHRPWIDDPSAFRNAVREALAPRPGSR